jgi:hypothetical protein
VAALPEDDARLGQIHRVYNSEDEEAIAAYDGPAILIVGEHGFAEPGANTDELLDKLAKLAGEARATSFGLQLPPKRLR